MRIGEIFISHTHADRAIADALSAAIKSVFGDLLTTSYSTKKELDGGIKPGEEWFRWIVERVRSADVAVILLTPASTQKPWVLWEAGAVYGAGIASSEASARKVRPLVFKLSGSQVPSPFAGIQGVNGDDHSGIDAFLSDLINDFQPRMEKEQVLKAGRMLGSTIGTYLDQVQKALREAPLLPTEAAVQEWCERLDQLAAERRLSEVRHLHDWLNLTFGRGRDERPLPLDLRLHRRLGEAYRASKRPDRAAEEFELALEFAPRDIFLLRALGLAYLDGKRHDDATRVIDRIAELDKDAFSGNVECAALKARLQRERNDLEGAAATYRQARECNPESYYLADVLGASPCCGSAGSRRRAAPIDGPARSPTSCRSRTSGPMRRGSRPRSCSATSRGRSAALERSRRSTPRSTTSPGSKRAWSACRRGWTWTALPSSAGAPR